MRFATAILAALAVLSATRCLQAAPSCEQFKAAIIEGAARYQAPAPKFRLEHVNSADPAEEFWTIAIFNDVRAMMSCRHGRVDTFAADANDRQTASTLHLLLLMGIGIHGYGLAWRPALDLRDELVRIAKASDPQMSKLPVDRVGEASLVISFAGVPSFQIDPAD